MWLLTIVFVCLWRVARYICSIAKPTQRLLANQTNTVAYTTSILAPHLALAHSHRQDNHQPRKSDCIKPLEATSGCLMRRGEGSRGNTRQHRKHRKGTLGAVSERLLRPDSKKTSNAGNWRAPAGRRGWGKASNAWKPRDC